MEKRLVYLIRKTKKAGCIRLTSRPRQRGLQRRYQTAAMVVCCCADARLGIRVL